jgi:hypothetical protein
VASDRPHRHEDDRHRHADDPGAPGELGQQHDHEDRPGEQRAGHVDGLAAPHVASLGRVLFAAQEPVPVPHHAALAAHERDEDPDDVELDKPGDFRLEGHDEQRREARQQHDAVAERQAVAAGVQLAGQVTVLRQD